MAEIYDTTINGLVVRTGDLICTVDGERSLVPGQFWWFVGRLIPGEVDHIVVYVGPGGRCVEAGAKAKVVEFEAPPGGWDAHAMFGQRGFVDRFYGVAYPLENRDLSPEATEAIRGEVADYCLAKVGKPYNLNFLNPDTEAAFYCSQLAWKAYLPHGIDFNTGLGVEGFPGSERIIFPHEVWASCRHAKAPEA